MRKILVVIIILFANLLSAFSISSKELTRIDSLIHIMTLDEKIGQMTQLCFSTITLDGSKSLDLNVDNFRESVIKYNIGSFLSGSDSYDKWFKFITAIQKIAVEETRLKIPLIIGIDHVHGANYVTEGTIFPHNISLACSFNQQVVAKVATVCAIETAPIGLTWNFAPVLDVGKNPYWPRFYETFGEDPFLCSEMGKTFIKTYEGCPHILPAKLSACAKHFIGYSDPKYGYDRTPSEIPAQVLWEFFVPPFKAAFDAGVKTVMINSGELNGEAVHGSKYLLDTLLRQQLGFKGVVVTDIKDIERLELMHKTVENQKEGTFRSVDAGIDMYMACNSYLFIRNMKELVAEGRISMKRIDESVGRILRLKFELGLFDNPYPSKQLLSKVNQTKNQIEAREVAEESIVLLKNDGILPLSKGKKILISGLGANSKGMLNGPWTFDWLGAPENQQPQNMKSLYESMQDKFGTKNLKYVDLEGINSEKEKKQFIRDAKNSDIILLAVGEKPYSEFMGNINDLTLDKMQLNLMDAAIETGKPVVVVLLEGRPRVFTEQADKINAILFAGYPGIKGAEALVNILSGSVNPSGKLAFTYPLSVGHVSPYYNKPSEYNIYWKNNPVRKNLFPFGQGLSYTNFEYSKLELSDTIFTKDNQEIMATIRIKNTGNLPGKEAVLWYVSDEIGTISRPVTLLKHFEKIDLKEGEEKTVKFIIKPNEQLSYPDKNGCQILENGSFKILVGGLEKRFYINKTNALF
ncbi:MAG: beta-glucosidase [Paludibacter sp.]|nr:beta-glucosidase [Paludibacter sp.]